MLGTCDPCNTELNIPLSVKLAESYYEIFNTIPESKYQNEYSFTNVKVKDHTTLEVQYNIKPDRKSLFLQQLWKKLKAEIICTLEVKWLM